MLLPLTPRAAEITGVVHASGYPDQGTIEDTTPQTNLDGKPLDLLEGKTYRGNLHRTGVHETPPLKELKSIKWKADLGAPIHSSPIVTDGIAYVVAGNGVLHALDASTGGEKWKFSTEQKKAPFYMTPTISEDRVFLNDSAGTVYCLDAKSGAEVWKVKACQSTPDSVTVAYGIVFLTDTKGQVYGLSAATGEQVWKARKSDRGYHGSSGTLTAIVSDHLYISFVDYDGYFGVDIPSGTFFWRGDAEMNGKTSSPGAAVGKFIYKTIFTAGGVDRINIVPEEMKKMNNSRLFVKVFDGQKRMGGGGVSGYEMTGACAGKGDFAYAGCADGKLYGFNMADLKIQWGTDLGEPIHSSVSMAGEVLYCGGAKGTVFAVASDGKLLSKIQTGGSIVSSPWITDGTLYVTSTDGHLYAIQ